MKERLDSHIKFIDSLYKILPITKCIIEVASFDIQKMKNDNISGVEYQQGDMMGFWNTREYVLHGVVLAKRKFTTLSQLFTIQYYYFNVLT